MTLTDQLARQEEHYTNCLSKQLRDIEKLAGLLDEVVTSSARLRSSRFWTFANKAVEIEAKLFRNKVFVPDRRFQKIIANYSRWRASHPDIANLDKPIHRAESPASGNDFDTRLERSTSGLRRCLKTLRKRKWLNR
jgi:hypothetical protein